MARTATAKSIIAVANESDVSVATVSRVLNNHPDVSDELRERVTRVLAKRGVHPRANRNRSTHLAIVLQFESPVIESFAADVLAGISKYALEQGLETSIILQRGNDGNKDLVKTLRERRCAGTIIFSASQIKDQLPELAKSGIATVIVAEQTDVAGIGFLATSSMEGASQLTQHLIDLGHRKIGFLCSTMNDKVDHMDRLGGYKKTMAAAGNDVDPRWIIPHQPTEQTQEAGYLQAKKLLETAPEVTAIFATNDEMAYGAIVACVELGRRVPQDISVVGFDDYLASKFFNPPLTTFRQPLKDIGYEAAKATDTFARGILTTLPRRVFQGELRVRKSTARVNES